MTSPYAYRYRWGTTRTIGVTGTSAGSTAAFGEGVHAVRIVSPVAAHVLLATSSGSTATTSDPKIPGNWVEYITVSPGQFAIMVSASTATGTATITEVS